MHEQQADNIRPYDIVGAIHNYPPYEIKKEHKHYIMFALFLQANSIFYEYLL